MVNLISQYKVQLVWSYIYPTELLILFNIDPNMNTHIEGKLYNVTIEASFVKATTNIKFPSLFFITWKTNDHKHSA